MIVLDGLKSQQINKYELRTAEGYVRLSSNALLLQLSRFAFKRLIVQFVTALVYNFWFH